MRIVVGTALAGVIATVVGVLWISTEQASGGTAPLKLVGTYTRVIAKTSKAAAYDPTLIGKWRMVLSRNGRVAIHPPLRLEWGMEGPYSATADRIAFLGRNAPFYSDNACATGVYQWKINGRALALALVRDPSCPPRRAVLIGVWTIAYR
jgi:hypothetical protein